METKKIPFDITRINEEGVKVVTRGGRNARVVCTDLKGDKKIATAVTSASGEYEYVKEYYTDGRYYKIDESDADLMLEIPVKSRRMTNQELSWWLREHPEEHREMIFRYEDEMEIQEERRFIHYGYTYSQATKDEPVDNVLIRSNGGEWHKPLIEE